MGNAIGQVLPLAVGVALSPVPIAAVILMLFTPRARSNGPAFALGWVLGIAVVSTAVLMVSGAGDVATSDSGGPSTTVGWLKLALGVVLILLAGRRWRNRPHRDDTPEPPGWMNAIDTFTPVKSLLLGALLSGVNPKNLALILAATTTIAAAGLPGSDEAIVAVVFAVLASITVVTPVLAYLVMGRRAENGLESAQEWMITNNNTVMAVILVVFGVKLLGDGISIVS